MKNIFLTLMFLVSLSAGAIPLTSTEPNASMNRTPADGDRSSTVARTTALTFDCPACRAAEAASRGTTGRTPQSIADANNTSLSPSSRKAFIPGLTPLRKPDPASSGQESNGSAPTNN